MSTIINALVNHEIFTDEVSNNMMINNNTGFYNVIGGNNALGGAYGGYNGYHHHAPNPNPFTTTPSSDSPSLENLAPELDDVSINRLKFVVLGILGSILAVLGFLGNTMSMVVLQQRQMRSSTSYYLLSLAIYDNIILLSMLVYFIIPALAIHMPFMKEYLTQYSITEPIGYPLSLTAQMGSIYTCVGFTVERFIAVCRPLQVANTCTKSRTIRAIVLIFVWAVLYNIPRFFHLKAVYFYDSDTTSIYTSTLGSNEADNKDSSTAGLLTTLASSYVGNTINSFNNNNIPPHQISSHLLVHQNASSSSLPLDPSQSSFYSSLSSRPPCYERGASGAERNGVLSPSPSVDTLYYGLISPCIPSQSLNISSAHFGAFHDNLPSSDTNDNSISSDSSSLISSLSSSSSSSSSSLHGDRYLISILQPSTSTESSASSLPLSTLSGAFPSSSSPPPPTTTTTTSSSIGLPPPPPLHSQPPPSPPSPSIKYVKALPTSFGSNAIFLSLYLIYSQLFFMFLLPFLIILFMNIGLIRAVKRSKAMQQRMGTSASARKERNLTVMLIAVIVVFLVCQFPTIIDNILIAVFGTPKLYPNYQYQCFYAACTLMVLVNSASNFLLYCFFGKKFRVVFLSLLGLKRRQQYVAYRSTMYRSRSIGSRGCDLEMSVV